MLLRRSCLAAIICLVASTTADAQAAPSPGSDPQGVVLDEQLRPLAGATVSLQWEQGGEARFGRAIAARLQRSPLPETRSGRDGSYVLPLTEEQRQMGIGTYLCDSGCWLVVEKEGFLPWREPIPAGLASYLGSRVLLRAVRDGDPFAELPWPPAVVSILTQRGFLPWLAPGMWGETTSRRGGRAAGDGLTPVPVGALGTLDFGVTAAGTPMARAQVWFDDGAFALPAGAAPLPFTVGDDGRASVQVPAGRRTLLVTAPGFLPQEVTVAVAPGRRESCAMELLQAQVVDVVAVSAAGVPVPFVRLDILPKEPNDPVRSSFTQFSDASGRARLFVDRADAWTVSSDREDAAGREQRVDLDSAAPAPDAWVRVVKHRPVTVRLDGKDWPTQGNLRWEAPGSRPWYRAFKFAAKEAPWVVLRMCYRELADITIGGDRAPPIRIRAEDLPPMPAEPLLDLVRLDRTVRPRAMLVLPDALGSVRQFVVGPAFRADRVWDAGETIQFAHLHDGEWRLLARDDGPLEVFATARGVVPLRFPVPAADGGRLPRIELPLQKR